ncbi:hypothetical protein I4U23_002324 [Adineta vaga]|nr:hypothetical protein I4U23_002324 [Adineta vaga]
MAIQYALNISGIVATNLILRNLYNQCDVINICIASKAYIEDLKHRYMNIATELIIVDSLFQNVATCNFQYIETLSYGIIQLIQ